MKSTLFVGTIVALVTLGSLAGTASAAKLPSGDKDVILQDVELRPGVTDDIHLRVHANPRVTCNSNAILAIHGANGTAALWEPMAQAIFASHQGGAPVCKFIAMDLPGHGRSSLPNGALFGDLTLNDYAAAVIGTLERLEGHGVHVREIMGHSMGGLVTQIVQQDLVDQGSSLRDAFGIKRVALMAPVMPQALPCSLCENPAIGALLAPYIGFDPILGMRLAIPDALVPVLAFSRPDGTIASNAPTVAEITARGYNSPESFAALSQLIGVPPAERPAIDEGIFAHDLGTKLDVVTFENDALILPEEGEALYQYLTGDDELSRFTVVLGENAVHGLPISDPAAVLDAMEETAN